MEMEMVFLYTFQRVFQVGNKKIFNTTEDIESIFIRINVMKTKWLLSPA